MEFRRYIILESILLLCLILLSVHPASGQGCEDDIWGMPPEEGGDCTPEFWRKREIDALEDYGIEQGVDHISTFDVVPNHIYLTSNEGEVYGVRFNTESAPKALENHFHKEGKSRQDVLQFAKHACAAHYSLQGNVSSWGEPYIQYKPDDIKLEGVSETKTVNVVSQGADGFIMACLTSFAQHLPLTLAPDHIWILISYAFAKHVDKNAEALRKNFVDHKGKKRLLVETPNSFQMSDSGNPDTGASPIDWEHFVFPEFSRQIKESIGEETHKVIASSFTTTTATARAAHEITLMSAMKKYFSYGMSTMCGIPSITLLGTEDDWVSLRVRAEKLGSLMLPESSSQWMPLLLPVLDEFVASYQGKVNHQFWQTMVKLRHEGRMSGGHPFISGWVQLFFPYLADGRVSGTLRKWQDLEFSGPELEEFPSISSTAPVDWDYHGHVIDLTFHAGITGFTQDQETGSLSPLLGWYVSHVPLMSASHKMEGYKKELEQLEEYGQYLDEDDDGHSAFASRVTYLEEEITRLESQVAEEKKAL